jgi:xylose isomerase
MVETMKNTYFGSVNKVVYEGKDSKNPLAFKQMFLLKPIKSMNQNQKTFSAIMSFFRSTRMCIRIL